MTLERLAERGLRTRFGAWHGFDGMWEEIEIEAEPVAPLPFLIRRITPPEIAADWPPALMARHPCGAVALAAVHLKVPHLAPARDIYARLTGSEARTIEAESALFQSGSGRIVIHEIPDSSPAIAGFELRVTSLEYTRQYLSSLGTTTRYADGTLWADLSINWKIGFCQ